MRLEGAFDDAEDFRAERPIAAARANPHLYRGARVWIDVGTEDPFRSADTELAGLLPARFRLWRGGHEIRTSTTTRPRSSRFYRTRCAIAAGCRG